MRRMAPLRDDLSAEAAQKIGQALSYSVARNGMNHCYRERKGQTVV